MKLVQHAPRKAPGRPAKATSALVPAAARRPAGLTADEAVLNLQAIDVFATAVGGRAQLAAVLSVASPSGELDKVATYLLDARYAAMPLGRLCSLAGITVAHLFASYKKALLTRAHIEATHIIAARLPPIVDDVMTMARSDPTVERQKLALELGQLTEKKGGILVQQNNQVAASASAFSATGPGALEQLHQAVGDLLFSPRRQRKGGRGTATIDADVLGDPPADPPEPRWPVEEEPELPFGDPATDAPLPPDPAG